MKKRKSLIFSVICLMYASLYIASCENTFEPIQENDRYHFSIFGVLDSSVDTQWVRVMPLTDSIFVTSREPIDAEVTIRHNSTGDISVLNDSLFRYSDFTYAWNFWTTDPIQAGEEYTLKAEASDGSTSSATVTIPPDFPMPVVNYSEAGERGNVTGSGVERMVVADIIYTIQFYTEVGLTPETEVTISHLDRVTTTTSGVFRFFPNDRGTIASEYNVPGGSVRINEREVVIVSGSPEWPDYKDLNEDEIFLPETSSNIEKGLGVLAGIVSKRFPLESCYDEEGELIACPPSD